jgi:hypothetical protein
MSDKIIIDPGKKTFSGNLHMHTTRSDGKLKPGEAVRRYSDSGYDFLALTDHYCYSEEQDAVPFCLSGAEYDSTSKDGLEVFHIVSIGTEKDPEVSRSDNVQQTINRINEAGGVAILAHPCWSFQTLDSILPLHGLAGMEIYNSVSAPPFNCRPESSYFSDLLSQRGMILPCLASDDSHMYTYESCTSRIVISSDELNRESVLNAIREGTFYATRGPRIFSASYDGSRIHVKCSPCKMVVFFDNLIWTPNRSLTSESITEFDYEILKGETFVRIELVDSNGNKAWMSPVPVNN